jgi:hypothetical protein
MTRPGSFSRSHGPVLTDAAPSRIFDGILRPPCEGHRAASKHAPWTTLGAAFLLAGMLGRPGAAHAHEEGMDLLPPVEQADFVAVVSGNWSNPATWGGQVPVRDNAGATLDIAIPQGIQVTVDGFFSGANRRIDTIRLEGTLEFATGVSTRLVLDTLVSSATGVLRIGMPGAPIAADRTAEIVISSDPIPATDTLQRGKGLILNGPVRMYGASKLPFTFVRDGYGPGSDRLELADPPTGWRVGDEIVLAPTRFVRASEPEAMQGEKFRVRAIQGNVVLLGLVDNASTPATLQYDHTPYDGQQVHVANLTRNVVIRSSNPDATRGHVMIHRGGARIGYTEFRELGRTDKKVLLDDGDETTAGTNQRGRYPLHFHQTLDAVNYTMARVEGAVVNGSPGWGFVNHSSDVEFTDCVSWNVDGAGFVAEASDEIGAFENNIAIQGYGAPDGRYARRKFEGDDFQTGRNGNGDLAFTGDGFWVQSPAVRVVDNVAAGFQGHAFILWNMGLFEPGPGEQVGFRPEYLWDPAITYRYFDHPGAQHHMRALSNDLPAREFSGNVAYASFMGFMVRFHHQPNLTLLIASQVPFVAGKANYLTRTTLSNLTAWNNEIGLGLSYVWNLTIDGATVVTDQGFPLAINADHNLDGNGKTTIVSDLTIAGYQNGIDFGTESPVYQLPGFVYDVAGWVLRHGGAYCWPADYPSCP